MIPSGEPLPSNILNNKNVQVIDLACLSTSNATWKLTIHPEAFISSKSSAWKFSIASCDVSELDLGFLSNLPKLTEVKLGPEAMNVGIFLTKLGSVELPPLNKLTLERCEGFQILTQEILTPANFTSLQQFTLTKALDFRESLVPIILDWLISSSAEDTLENLNLDDNGLETISYDVANAFVRLRFFSYRNNRVSVLKQSSFLLARSNLFDIGLSYNNISVIEEGAFQGNLFLAIFHSN